MLKKKVETKTAVTKKPQSIVDIKGLAKIIYDESVEWGKALDLYPKSHKKPKKKYTEKAKKLDKILSQAEFGCQEPHIRKILEIGFDLKMPPTKTKEVSGTFLYKFGTVVVPLSDPEGAGLPVGEAVLLRNNHGSFFKKDKDASDSELSHMKKNLKSIRLATLNEIEDLLETIMENTDLATALAVFSLQKM